MNSAVPPLMQMQDLLNELADKPYAMDLFAFMRRAEASAAHLPKWGYANKYHTETLQFGQEPSAIFPSASICKLYQYAGTRKPKVSIHSFGLFGSHGPMPTVFTEYVKERMAHHNDYAMSDFIDIFHNRMIMLFYRAWADANSCANLDRSEAPFTAYIASLCAAGYSINDKNSIPTHARWHNVGHLLRQARNAEGLQNILRNFFKVPVRIEEFVERWLPLPSDQQTQLGSFTGTQLGVDTVLGTKVMSKQHHFRIHIGPLTMEEYEQFLPRKQRYQQLRDWVRTYTALEFTWDLCLTLKQSVQRIGLQLGPERHLGWNSWLGDPLNSPHHQKMRQVIFHPESSI